jgi:hypothetical protein
MYSERRRKGVCMMYLRGSGGGGVNAVMYVAFWLVFERSCGATP